MDRLLKVTGISREATLFQSAKCTPQRGNTKQKGTDVLGINWEEVGRDALGVIAWAKPAKRGLHDPAWMPRSPKPKEVSRKSPQNVCNTSTPPEGPVRPVGCARDENKEDLVKPPIGAKSPGARHSSSRLHEVKCNEQGRFEQNARSTVAAPGKNAFEKSAQAEQVPGGNALEKPDQTAQVANKDSEKECSQEPDSEVHVRDVSDDAEGSQAETDMLTMDMPHVCQDCEEAELSAGSAHGCVQCAMMLCQTCSEFHLRSKRTRNHTLKPLHRFIADNLARDLAFHQNRNTLLKTQVRLICMPACTYACMLAWICVFRT